MQCLLRYFYANSITSLEARSFPDGLTALTCLFVPCIYTHHHHDLIDYRYLYDDFITSIAAGSFAGLTSLSCLYERVHITAESSSIRFFSQSDGVQLRHADHPRLAGRPHAACLSVWSMHAHTLSCVLTPVNRWLYHNSLTSIQTASFSGLTSLKSL